MRIGIMGAGAVGSYYGALLQRTGHDVVLIARGDHLSAIRENGLQVKSHFGDFQVSPEATDRPEDVEPVDLILFTVKTYDTHNATQQMIPLLHENTTVLPLQNVNMAHQIGEVVGHDKMLGGLTYILVARQEPGIISHTSDFHRLFFGELGRKQNPRAEKIHDVLASSGAEIILSDHIERELWTKLLFISPTAAVSSIVKLPMGDYRDVPETRQLLESAMKEIEAIARAYDVDLDQDIVDNTLRFVDSLDPGAITSTQRDVMAGRKSEVEELIGYIPELGKAVGVPTPAYDFLYAVLRPQELHVRQPN